MVRLRDLGFYSRFYGTRDSSSITLAMSYFWINYSSAFSCLRCISSTSAIALTRLARTVSVSILGTHCCIFRFARLTVYNSRLCSISLLSRPMSAIRARYGSPSYMYRRLRRNAWLISSLSCSTLRPALLTLCSRCT